MHCDRTYSSQSPVQLLAPPNHGDHKRATFWAAALGEFAPLAPIHRGSVPVHCIQLSSHSVLSSLPILKKALTTPPCPTTTAELFTSLKGNPMSQPLGAQGIMSGIPLSVTRLGAVSFPSLKYTQIYSFLCSRQWAQILMMAYYLFFSKKALASLKNKCSVFRPFCSSRWKVTIKNRENESLVFALHSKFDPQSLKSVENDAVSFSPWLLCTTALYKVIRMALWTPWFSNPQPAGVPLGAAYRRLLHAAVRLLRGQQNTAAWSICARRGGKPMVGSDWEQGSYNSNVGTSSLREAGEAGRRRNLSRKRTFIADTSKNIVSSHWRNVSSTGKAAALACHSFRWIQCSCKSVWKKCFCSFPVESSRAKRKTRQGGTAAAPRDVRHPLLAAWWC